MPTFCCNGLKSLANNRNKNGLDVFQNSWYSGLFMPDSIGRLIPLEPAVSNMSGMKRHTIDSVISAKQ